MLTILAPRCYFSRETELILNQLKVSIVQVSKSPQSINLALHSIIISFLENDCDPSQSIQLEPHSKHRLINGFHQSDIQKKQQFNFLTEDN